MILSGSPVQLTDGRLGYLIDAWVWTEAGSPIKLTTGEVVMAHDFVYRPGPLDTADGPGPATDLFGGEVARGAAWLDAKVPGWRERIDWPMLDMSSTDDDLAGQLGIDTNDLSVNDMVRLGWRLSTDQADAHWPAPDGSELNDVTRSIRYGALMELAYNHLTRAWFHAHRPQG